ncbi:stage III sporulation protein AE [Anaerotruncus rubiinfantis]|uniref:stage III sporulation protein AE n=1 Tax=Anaerotruncus rubiinfantis TaxID=1720200 RepID=UPI00082EF922|nr:stage III sporulation protein AE [Anaerotruncus rubiinfantis]
MKWTALVLAFCLLVFGLCVPACAADLGKSELGDYDYQAQLDAAGADELFGNLPQDAQSLLDDTGITGIDYKQLLSLSPKDFFQAVWQLVLERVRMPLTVFGSVLGTILLCALLDSLKTSLWEGTLSSVFSAVAVVCIATSIIAPIVDCITSTARAIHDGSNFILAFIPVFSTVVTVSGQPVTAGAYTAFLFMACQVVAQIVSSVLVPLMGIYLAFCIAGSLAPGIDVNAVAQVIRKTVSWALGLLLTIFVGLLSLQTMVASGSDTVVSKTAKFLIGSFVPVVGSALSDAFVATQGYMKLLKTTVGVFGVLVAAMTFLPILLQTVMWYLAVNLSSALGEMLGVKPVAQILKSASATLGVLIAVILCFALLIIISTSLVLIISMGV